MSAASAPIPRHVLLSRTVVGIVLATFFSDVGHEMVTAVLPLYLTSLGLGAAALGVMEGFADLLFSISKLGGGVLGHHVEKKRAWGAAGYLMTALGTGLMAFARGVPTLVVMRGVAWIGRGFRSPLRDFLLSDAVPKTHFGRVYGVERTADMLGAVAGPMIAALLLWLHVDIEVVIVASLAPSLLAAGAFFFLTRDAPPPQEAAAARLSTVAALRAIPRAYWVLLGGVFVFGLGDFSRSFLVYLAANSPSLAHAPSTMFGTAVLLYTLHNGVSALAAYPIGHIGDRSSKLRVLAMGYGLGVVTNLTLATVANNSLLILTGAIVLSGITIAVEETLEKAACAELLPRELRSLGLGVLAATNAFGDMLSSVFVGWQLQYGSHRVAFGVPALLGAIGAVWVFLCSRPSGAARAPS